MTAAPTEHEEKHLTYEEQIKLLVESIQDYAIFVLDENGYVATWNPGAERIKGYAPDEIIGKHFSVFYSEADLRAGKPARMLETATREGRAEDEGWRMRSDGSRFWANVLITALHHPDGSCAGFAKITRDITERRLAEDELHQSEERFRLLIDALRDYSLVMLSAEGIVISWNAAAQRLHGYSSEEIIGRHFSAFYPGDDVRGGKPDLELELALAEGRFEEEAWRVRADDTRFWANVVITPVRDAHGKLLGFAKITRDVTERRRAREELLASQQHARQLTNENIAKDEFLGLIAHELRTPLSVLFGGTRLLLQHDGNLEDQQRSELIGSLATEAERLKDLVESLLLLVNPSPDLDLKPMLLQGQVSEAIGHFERDQPNRKVEPQLLDEELRAFIEPALLQRVVINLLTNADKYSPRGRPIEVRLAREADNAVVEVRDRGPGVNPAELSMIFTSFYRSPGAHDLAPGKGLGLAICRRLVELMGGSIEARARDGGGLVVRFTLPLYTPPASV